MSVVNVNLNGGGQPTVGSVIFVANVGSPQTFNPLGNLGNWKWGMKTKSVDVTNQGTPWTQAIPTIRDGSTITLDIHFVPQSAGSDGTAGIEGHSFATGLGMIFTLGQTRSFKIVYPDGTTWYFTAFILDFPIDAQVEKDLMASLTLQVTGEPLFA